MSPPSHDWTAPEDFEFRALERARNYQAALVREFTPYLRGRVLEVGAGVGQFSARLAALPDVQQSVALEPDPRFCAEFRARHPTCALIEGTIDRVAPDSEWDALVSINVLEHIEADAEELAKYRRKLVARRGCLCLFVPARQEIYAQLDRDFGHFRRYQRRDLGAKLERAGFVLVRLHYFNCFGYFAWWLNFCLLRKRHFDARSVALFDRVIFPVMHGFERRIIRPPLGQNLLAVAQVR